MLKFIAPTTAWLRHVGTAAAATVAVVGVLAGLSPDDQTRLLGAVRQFVDGATNVLAAVGTVSGIGLALWARWTAKPAQQIAAVQALPNAEVVPVDPFKPLTSGAPGATVSSHWLAGALALILLLPLGACGDAPGDRQAAADRVTLTYTALKSAVVLYAALPACGEASATAVCSSPAIVAQVTKALGVADTAVAEAKAQILAAPDQSSAEKWSSYALAAIDVLAKALATYGVKAGAS